MNYFSFLWDIGKELLPVLGQAIGAKLSGDAAKAEQIAKDYVESHATWQTAYADHGARTKKAEDEAERILNSGSSTVERSV